MGSHRSSTAAWSATVVPRTILVSTSILVLGLAAGCPTVDLGDTPEDVGLCNPRGGLPYFQDVIWPNFVRPTDSANGCTKAVGCHVFGGGNLLGFKIDPVDFPANYRAARVQLECDTPMSSRFLTKPLAGIDAHGGMDIYSQNAPEVQLFLQWFE